MNLRKLALTTLIVSILFLLNTSTAFARQRFATLPGGLLYPQFAASAFTNAAALSSDWYSEVQALYSPEIADRSNPHSYFVGYATSNPKVGFNIGYLGSIQSGVAVHNLFSGVSARHKKHAFGLAIRKNDVAYSSSIPIDASWMWDITRRVTLGVVGYDILDNRSLALGVGYENYSYYSLEVDAQFPLPGYLDFATREYSINFASVFYFFKPVGISVGTRYQKWDDINNESSKWRHTLGAVVKLKGRMSLVGLYTSAPDTFTVGLCWGTPATAQQWIEYWLARDRRELGL